ncbi:hypothetical protein VNO80_13649 [Phaseolus coccineus]|uniref:Uncharacterized protein n=1 Tax=Phaseolus coccineus TaxID=3886 RepID=A0AAN9N6N1_PHACN
MWAQMLQCIKIEWKAWTLPNESKLQVSLLSILQSPIHVGPANFSNAKFESQLASTKRHCINKAPRNFCYQQRGSETVNGESHGAGCDLEEQVAMAPHTLAGVREEIIWSNYGQRHDDGQRFVETTASVAVHEGSTLNNSDQNLNRTVIHRFK